MTHGLTRRGFLQGIVAAGASVAAVGVMPPPATGGLITALPFDRLMFWAELYNGWGYRDGLSLAAGAATSDRALGGALYENKGSHFCRNDKRRLSENAPVAGVAQW